LAYLRAEVGGGDGNLKKEFLLVVSEVFRKLRFDPSQPGKSADN
jgi:hypothetical protein